MPWQKGEVKGEKSIRAAGLLPMNSIRKRRVRRGVHCPRMDQIQLGASGHRYDKSGTCSAASSRSREGKWGEQHAAEYPKLRRKRLAFSRLSVHTER